jgi:hypothetical protein
MEFLFAFIITKQSGISCVTILSKHFCIFLKHGKELKGEDVEASFKLECAKKSWKCFCTFFICFQLV